MTSASPVESWPEGLPAPAQQLAALRRAARASRKFAEATGSPLCVWRNGKVVDLNPQPRRKRTAAKATPRGEMARKIVKRR